MSQSVTPLARFQLAKDFQMRRPSSGRGSYSRYRVVVPASQRARSSAAVVVVSEALESAAFSPLLAPIL